MKQQFMITRFIIYIMLFSLNLLYSEITLAERFTMNEIAQLNVVLKNATSGSLVIFDVDEVLIYPENIVQLQVASSFWEATMAGLEKRLGKPTRDLLHSIMLLQTNWKLTDNLLPIVIRDLQSKKINVLALTAFGSGEMGKIKSIEDWRNMQLKEYGMDFSLTLGLPKNHFEIKNLNIIRGKTLPIYKNGIIYANQYSKGEVLRSFLEQIDFNPKEIIFIDDRISNVQDIEKFCKFAKIKFIGIHDTRIMKKYNVFNKILGKYQFHHLEHYHVWLSDSEAKKMIKGQGEKVEITNN